MGWSGSDAQAMLNRKVVALGRALIPRFVIDQINPFDRFVVNAVREFSAKLPPHSLVLDAGAGEAQYRPDVAEAGHQYRAIDLGVGEGDWNYGKIDAWARVEALPFPAHTFDGHAERGGARTHAVSAPDLA